MIMVTAAVSAAMAAKAAARTKGVTEDRAGGARRNRARASLSRPDTPGVAT
jgi:hypothetical protein